MRKYIFGWDNALQGDSLSKMHACYIAAFDAIKSPLADNWRKKQTAELLSNPPGLIWENRELWGDLAETAKAAFYERFNYLPIIPLREGARAILEKIHGKNAFVIVVSNKSQPILEYEISELGIRGYVDYIIGSDDTKLSREELLKKADDYWKASSDVLVVAGPKYQQAAENLGFEYLPASTGTFRKMFSDVY